MSRALQECLTACYGAASALLVVSGALNAPAKDEQAERPICLQSLQKVHQRWLSQRKLLDAQLEDIDSMRIDHIFAFCKLT